MHETQGKTAKAWRIGLFVLMVIIGGVAGYLVYRHRLRQAGLPKDSDRTAAEQKEKAPRLTAEEVLAAVRLNDVSIGHLENGPGEVEVQGGSMSGLELAVRGFSQLAEKLPNELLPLRNLTIAHLLLMQNPKVDVARARDEARAAAKRLLVFDSQSAIAHWLAALVELQPDPRDPMGVSDTARAEAVVLLERAVKLDPENPAMWYALSRGAAQPQDPELNDTARSALAKAYALDPRNLWLTTEWLGAQAKTKDAGIEQTLSASREVLAPLAPAIKKMGLDVPKTIDEAIEAVKAGDWAKVSTNVRRLEVTVRPNEVAKSDIVRVDVHPLEYVLYDFSPAFHAENKVPPPGFEEKTPVAFKAMAEGGLPELPGVLDVLLMDFDLDGLPDLLVLQPGKLRILSRVKLGGSWDELCSLDVPAGMNRLMAADLDRDRKKSTPVAPTAEAGAAGTAVRFDKIVTEDKACHYADPDIVVYGTDGVLVVRNAMESAESASKLVAVPNEGLAQLKNVTAGVLVDFDHDGDLDLVFCCDRGVTLWEGIEKLTFTDVSEFSTLPPAGSAITSLVAVDWDRDVDIDLMACDANGTLVGYLENLRHGQFKWTSFDAAYEQMKQPRSLAVLEADGNASWDLLGAGPNGVVLALTATPKARIVNLRKLHHLSTSPQTGVLSCDFDNDGYRDAVSWGEDGLHLFRGAPQGGMAAADVEHEAPREPIRTVIAGDVDRDGDLDLVVVVRDRVVVLLNDGGNKNGWITIYPLGQSDNKGRCNHHAIGSLIELRAAGWYQAQVVDAPTVHFGIGREEKADQVRVVWTNGVPQDIIDLRGNVAICEEMILKGSCPYVYTLADGKFSFFTDCLWAAPLGMQTAEGGIAPTRPWEYLHIPGSRLTPWQGSYWIKFTEELWEAGYFDQVRLIAIDHPADVEVFSNEKVGPAEIAEFKIHTVRNRRFPVSVRDQNGKDLSDKLRKADGDFVQAFDRRIRQGLTPEHFLELDLGSLENPRQTMLFLTGWILPTDTSLNIAFSQDPELDGPRMPSVWAVDANGDWKETIATMGFPGGKTKTIAVDLSRAFLTDDYRLRIKTTAEIYWDELFFTVDEPAVEVRQTVLVPRTAELAYHGFSAPSRYENNAPQVYDHENVRLAPRWPPMRGMFTRYGSVLELLMEADDMMAVIGAGDAVTVRFDLPDQGPPEGWNRDFFLHTVGWDKDADLNTIHGQTVEPLPYRAMTSYPYSWDESVPDSPAFHDYVRRYQTREQDPNQFWRRLLLEGAASGQRELPR